MAGDSVSVLAGTLTDVWVLIALIIPGFITFRVLTWLVAYEAKFEQFITTIYSLILSLIVFLPVAALHNFQSLDSLRDQIIKPEIMFELLGFGLLFGIIPGVIIKLTIRKQNRFGSPWSNFANDYVSKGVTVFTNDNKEYVGWIKRMETAKDDKRELSLGNPKLVKRDAGKYQLIQQGDELLFTESNIKRILRISPKSKLDSDMRESVS
jgi:hypothetical protein